MTSPRLHPALAWGLVALQFALIAVLAVLPYGTLWDRTQVVMTAGFVAIFGGVVIALVAIAGLGRTLTASPVPKAGGELVTTGVYAWVRHPIYTGIIVAALGLAFIGASVGHLIVAGALIVLLMVKSRLEERMLLGRYRDYAAYAARVGRLVPGVGRIRS
ncbi:MAG: hypothetical protein RL499_1627 [Actinomycetota bacterium]